MTVDPLCRFSVSMPTKLVQQLDQMVHARKLENRSYAIAEMVRNSLSEYCVTEPGHVSAGAILLVYDHHKPKLLSALTSLQHDYEGSIISALHVHLDHHNCMEILAVRGAAGTLRELAVKLSALRGIIQCRLLITTTGREFMRCKHK
jgi:CopG family transcriptional regulator, nickel-responsive regulator